MQPSARQISAKTSNPKIYPEGHLFARHPGRGYTFPRNLSLERLLARKANPVSLCETTIHYNNIVRWFSFLLRERVVGR